jgi:hypothetical protein
MSDSLQERCARAAYHAAMTMRGDSLSPACVWEGLPHRWQLIYRVQARAVLDLLDAEAIAHEVSQPDLFGEAS